METLIYISDEKKVDSFSKLKFLVKGYYYGAEKTITPKNGGRSFTKISITGYVKEDVVCSEDSSYYYSVLADGTLLTLKDETPIGEPYETFKNIPFEQRPIALLNWKGVVLGSKRTEHIAELIEKAIEKKKKQIFKKETFENYISKEFHTKNAGKVVLFKDDELLEKYFKEVRLWHEGYIGIVVPVNMFGLRNMDYMYAIKKERELEYINTILSGESYDLITPQGIKMWVIKTNIDIHKITIYGIMLPDGSVCIERGSFNFYGMFSFSYIDEEKNIREYWNLYVDNGHVDKYSEVSKQEFLNAGQYPSKTVKEGYEELREKCKELFEYDNETDSWNFSNYFGKSYSSYGDAENRRSGVDS